MQTSVEVFSSGLPGPVRANFAAPEDVTSAHYGKLHFHTPRNGELPIHTPLGYENVIRGMNL